MIKARKQLSSEEWKEIEYVQLRDSYVLHKAEEMEFDAPVRVIKGNIENWQDVRERAAIAALSGLLSDPEQKGMPSDFAEWSVEYADALVEELKKR